MPVKLVYTWQQMLFIRSSISDVHMSVNLVYIEVADVYKACIVGLHTAATFDSHW